MEEWKECKLGDVCIISSSKRIFAEEYVTSGIPFYRGKEIIEKHNKKSVSSELFISPERFGEIKAKFPVPQKDDILLTSVGTLGIPWLVDEENFYFKDGNLTWFRSKKDIINPSFLYYWFESRAAKEQIDSMCIGSTQKALTIDTLSKFILNLPPLATQQKIAAILSSLDDKIELNNKINTNLEAQAQTIFKSWFVDFEPFGGKMPEGWRMGKLSDIAEITSGKRPPMKQSDLTNEVHIPLVGAASVMGYTNQILYNEPILITGRVGTHGIIQRFRTECWPSDNTLIVKSKNYEYVYQVMCNIDYVNMNRGSTQPLITQSDLGKVECVIPDDETLIKFGKITSILFEKHFANCQENQNLANLRDTLLPKLMNGEIEV